VATSLVAVHRHEPVGDCSLRECRARRAFSLLLQLLDCEFETVAVKSFSQLACDLISECLFTLGRTLAEQPTLEARDDCFRRRFLNRDSYKRAELIRQLAQTALDVTAKGGLIELAVRVVNVVSYIAPEIGIERIVKSRDRCVTIRQLLAPSLQNAYVNRCACLSADIIPSRP